MTKHDILNTIKDLPDDVNFVIGEDYPIKHAYQLKIQQVCGGMQQYMPYYCMLKPGHDGQCWCSCKDVDFDKEEF